MNKQKGRACRQAGFAPGIILVGIVVIMAVTAGAYYFGKSQASKSQTQNQIVVSQTSRTIVSAKPTQPPDETSNWKTYSSYNNSYTFKYPQDWVFQEFAEGCGPVFWAPNTKRVWFTDCGVDTNSDDTPLSIADRSTAVNKEQQYSRSSIVIDNHSGITQQLKPTPDQLNTELYIGDVKEVVLVDGREENRRGTLAIYFYVQDLSRLEETTKVFEKVLSALKFIP